MKIFKGGRRVEEVGNIHWDIQMVDTNIEIFDTFLRKINHGLCNIVVVQTVFERDPANTDLVFDSRLDA